MWYWYLLVEVFAGGRQTRQLLVQHVLLGTHAVTLHVLGPVQLPHVKVKHLQKDQSQFQTHRTRTRIEEHKTEHSSVSGRPVAGPAAGPASITFLSSLLIWDSSMVTFSVFHTHEWLVKYSRTIMALWRREMVFIILGGRGSVGRRLGRRLVGGAGRISQEDRTRRPRPQDHCPPVLTPSLESIQLTNHNHRRTRTSGENGKRRETRTTVPGTVCVNCIHQETFCLLKR